MSSGFCEKMGPNTKGDKFENEQTSATFFSLKGFKIVSIMASTLNYSGDTRECNE